MAKVKGVARAVITDALSRTMDATFRFELLPSSSLVLDRSPNYLIKGLMPRAELVVLYGPPGSGKSFLALDAALQVAAGREWAGCRVDPRGRGVVYIAFEGASGMRSRIIAATASRGLPADIPFALIEKAPDLGDEADLLRLIAEIKQQQHLKLGGREPSLIVFDTLARSMAGLNESDTRGMNIFIDHAKRLSTEFEALVMPVHHSGKDLDRGMRGSSALQGAADAIWCLKTEDGVNRFELEKMKDGASGLSKSFVLTKHSLGTDDDGDDITTLVVGEIRDIATPAQKPPEARARKADDADKVLPAVLRMIDADGLAGTNREGLADNVKALGRSALLSALSAWLARTRPELTGRSASTLAGRHLGTLIGRGIVLANEESVWSAVDSASSGSETKAATAAIELAEDGLNPPSLAKPGEPESVVDTKKKRSTGRKRRSAT